MNKFGLNETLNVQEKASLFHLDYQEGNFTTILSLK